MFTLKQPIPWWTILIRIVKKHQSHEPFLLSYWTTRYFQSLQLSLVALALVSEETSATFPLWKLDYSGKSWGGYIKHNSACVWFLKEPRTQSPWSETISSKNPLVSVTYSWTSSLLANFTRAQTLPSVLLNLCLIAQRENIHSDNG